MKLAIGFSTLLTLIFMSIIGYALFTDPITRIESSITVQTPAPVVCKILRDFDSYSKWSMMMQKKQDVSKPNYFLSIYRFDDIRLDTYEFIEPANGNNTIVFKQLENFGSGLIGKFQNQVIIRTLPDGATSIDWELNYTCQTLGTLLLNPIKIQPLFNRALSQHMLALERFLKN